MSAFSSALFLRSFARLSPVLAASAVVVACGPVTIPAKAPPTKTVPVLDVEPPAPSEGEGQVVVDAQDGPASVTLVLGQATAWGGGHQVSSLATREVCARTPCVVSLPAGQYHLIFRALGDPNRRSAGVVTVGRGTTVFRHNLGEQNPGGTAHSVGTLLTSLGLIGVIAGGSVWLAGAAADSDKTASAGRLTTLLSGAGMGLGIGLILSDRPTSQEGSSIQWSLGPQAPSPEPSLRTTEL